MATKPIDGQIVRPEYEHTKAELDVKKREIPEDWGRTLDREFKDDPALILEGDLAKAGVRNVGELPINFVNSVADVGNILYGGVELVGGGLLVPLLRNVPELAGAAWYGVTSLTSLIDKAFPAFDRLDAKGEVGTIKSAHAERVALLKDSLKALSLKLNEEDQKHFVDGLERMVLGTGFLVSDLLSMPINAAQALVEFTGAGLLGTTRAVVSGGAYSLGALGRFLGMLQEKWGDLKVTVGEALVRSGGRSQVSGQELNLAGKDLQQWAKDLWKEESVVILPAATSQEA
jgi:hypothetical protein